ncbi:MAG: MFS transporter [Polyangiaceae bacterium]
MWRLFAATLVNRLGGFVVPFLALYLGSTRGLSPSAVGLVVGCFGAGAIVGGPLGGFLADRAGRRRTITLGHSLTALAMLLVAIADNAFALAGTCLLLGASAEMQRPAVSAMLADLVPEQNRTRAFALIYWAANIGFACASILAGLAAHLSFGVLFVVDAATCLAAALLVRFTLPETLGRGAPTGRPARTPRWTDVLTPFKDSAFRWFFAASLLLALVFFQFHVAMPLDMRAHGIQPATYGLLVALNGGLVVALQPFATRLVLRLPRRAALAFASVLVALGFGLFGLTSTPLGYAIAISVFTIGEVVMAPVNPAVVSELAPSHLRGTYQGAYGLAISGASCFAPVLGGSVLAHVGSGALWLSAFLLGLVAAAVHLAARGRSAEPTPEPLADGAAAQHLNGALDA